ncbi:MAG: hypothetical protein WCH77_06385 [Planctomycetota bacterium]
MPEFNEFNANPLEGWDWDDDERLDDLILQLQEKELTLQAIDARVSRMTGRRAGVKMEDRMAWRSTSRMDLNGGGPVRWDVFYGRNAENFFYHPRDPNTTYHTTTVLKQVEPTSAGNVPGNQGVPAHQRPPQFDYIYRGYENKQRKAQEEARDLSNEITDLKSRRRQVEAEVVLLWIKIAFRTLDRDKVAEKPIVRWAVIPNNAGSKEDSERAVVLTGASQLLATALLFNEQRAEREPDKLFGTVGEALASNRRKFEDVLIRAGSVLDESEDKTKPIGQYKVLARKLEDTSKSLSEGYRGWKEGDRNDDEVSKFTGLRRVQDSVVTYAKILLSLNELVSVMKKDWNMTLNTNSTEFVPKWDVANQPMIAPAPAPNPANLVALVDLRRDVVRGKWDRVDGDLVSNAEAGQYATVILRRRPPAEYDYEVTFTPLRGQHTVTLNCGTTYGTGFGCCVGGWGNQVAGLFMLNGADADSNNTTIRRQKWLVTNQKHTMVVKVRRNSVSVSLDNAGVFNAPVNYGVLRYRDDVAIPTDSFGLSSWATSTRFHRAEVRAIGQEGARR